MRNHEHRAQFDIAEGRSSRHYAAGQFTLRRIEQDAGMRGGKRYIVKHREILIPLALNDDKLPDAQIFYAAPFCKPHLQPFRQRTAHHDAEFLFCVSRLRFLRLLAVPIFAIATVSLYQDCCSIFSLLPFVKMYVISRSIRSAIKVRMNMPPNSRATP